MTMTTTTTMTTMATTNVVIIIVVMIIVNVYESIFQSKESESRSSHGNTQGCNGNSSSSVHTLRIVHTIFIFISNCKNSSSV